MDEPAKGPVTLREIGADLRAEFLQWDRGLPGTLWAVSVRPAEVARAYLQARDRRYVRPLRYLLLSIVVSVAVSWLVYERFGLLQAADPEHAKDVPLLLDHAALITLLVLPLVAGVMRGLFHGLGVRYVDALVLLGYTQAQGNLFGVLAPLLLLAGAPEIATLALAGAVIVWMVRAWAGFASGPAWRRWVAAFGSLVLGQALNGAVVFALLQVARRFAD
jgi:hypothetical protein